MLSECLADDWIDSANTIERKQVEKAPKELSSHPHHGMKATCIPHGPAAPVSSVLLVSSETGRWQNRAKRC
jgi:hypothetical protein